jgi:hypothetical protein
VHAGYSDDYNIHRVLVTDFPVDALLRIRWGMDLLSVPLAAIAIAAISKRDLASIAIAMVCALFVAIGMAYFPAGVMSGHFRWLPLPRGYLAESLTYATTVTVTLAVVNRFAASMASTRPHVSV